MTDDPRGRPPYGDWTVPADQLPTAPLYVVTGQGVADGYVVDKSIVQEASVWNTTRLEPLRSQIVPADGAHRLMPVDAYPAVLVTDQHRADGHVVRTWWTRVDQPPPPPTRRADWRGALDPGSGHGGTR
jgi:hypothetical protein